MGKYYVHLEKKLLRDADEIVVISPAFTKILSSYGIPDDRVHVIENWAPLDEVVQKPKANDWSKARQLDDKFVFLYSGTLSLKHNPEALFELARQVEGSQAMVVVRSQGAGADWLRAKLKEIPLKNLIVEGYGPYEELSDALSAADALVGILEPEAAEFSVPSKVLTYLAAGRAILLAVPKENLAARIVTEQEAGLVSEPTDCKSFVEDGLRLTRAPDLCRSYGVNARRYAEQKFDIQSIARNFSEILCCA